jgi:hypothetical protein
MAKILGFQDVANPGSLHMRVEWDKNLYPPQPGGRPAPGPRLPPERVPCTMIVYTGFLGVGHFTGHDLTGLDIVFPLLAVLPAIGSGFPTVPGPGHRALLPISPNTLIGAVACVSPADAVDKTDPSISSVLSATADVRVVTLSDGRIPSVLTLAVSLNGQNSEIHSVAYQVTALISLVDFPPPAIRIVPATGWDGAYTDVGPAIQPWGNGVPQGGA